MNFIKMVQFTRVVKAGNMLREFNFRQLKSPDAELFTVNVCDERGNRVFFTMQKKDSDWKIVPGQFPPWIIQTENRLHSLIEEELSGNGTNDPS